MTSKEDEINALITLVEMGGYFADFFKCDLDMMIRNIQKDFPIEFETKFHFTEEQWQQSKRELMNAQRLKIIDLCDTMLRVHAETGNEKLYERAVKEMSLNFVIARKRQIGLELDNKDIDYLISQLSV